ncbi:hypothetical protein [Methylobacterium ajmalii]|uniref:hypothetical protein n=1 Tax=Methylobacterium ajmalii TaxID=2738439 RepID=UPI002F3514CC
MRVIICGGRDFLDGEVAFAAFDRMDLLHCIEGVIEGGQRTRDRRGRIIGGGDWWGHQWALARGIPCTTVEAEWQRWGRAAAGRIRNGAMLRVWPIGLVIALPGGPGTLDMIDQAERAGVPHERVGPWPLAAAA